MSDLILKINELESYRSKIIDEIKDEMTAEFKRLMSKVDERITSLGFTAYAPHFNDGEPCSFSVRCYDVMDFHLNGYYHSLERVDENGDHEFMDELKELFPEGNFWAKRTWDDSASDFVNNPEYNEEMVKPLNDLASLVNLIPEEIWESYQEHGLYIIQRDGTISSEYIDHD